jgi:Cysteine synthase
LPGNSPSSFPTNTSILINTTMKRIGVRTMKRREKRFGNKPKGTVTHFITGLGTTGTFTGVTRRLRECNGSIRAIGVQPDLPLHGIEGLKHLSTAHVPGIYDASLADEHRTVDTESSLLMTQRLAKEEGLFVGTSSGANVFAAVELARELSPGSVVVTILCDGGEKYLSANQHYAAFDRSLEPRICKSLTARLRLARAHEAVQFQYRSRHPSQTHLHPQTALKR